MVCDSIGSGYVQAKDKWFQNPTTAPFLTQIKGAYINPPAVRSYSNTSGSIASAGPYPTFYNNALAGRAILDVSNPVGPISIASFIDPNTPSTKAIVQLGVNDAAAGTVNGTLTTCINKANTDLVGAGVTGGIWIGPFTHGEKWPSGANDIDPAIDRVDALLASIVTGWAGWDYVSWRAIYTAQMPTRNPSNLSSGIYTTDGTHPRYQDTVGMAQLIGAAIAKMVLT